MKTQSKPTTSGITVRFPAPMRERLVKVARNEHRSAAAYIERLVEQDLLQREEAERVVHIHVGPNVPAPIGQIIREEGESPEAHAERAATLNALFGVRSPAG
jgi:predicted DNA-binding protein